ncbi:hypothetical protein [Nocardioides speluncae]|uniref:hypothetical protein n=1 Tax=Nocardioides speluncae TaxID=2670337 RepID=UPI000D68564F|nr:hypothetical protein [Nocardioides speluncae]
MRPKKGDKVTAVKAIGGGFRLDVPKGSHGTVTKAIGGGPLVVKFVVTTGLIGKPREVELHVHEDEITRAPRR